MSSAFHPQTDGQMERMNRLLEETMRHYVCFAQNDWDKQIQMVAFAINNAESESIKGTPFFLNKGRHPRMPCGLADLPLGTSITPKAKNFSAEMQKAVNRAQQCLLDAQTRQKAKTDTHRRDVTYLPGDEVLLSTKKLKMTGDDLNWAKHKLLPRYIGPYTIKEVINKVAMKLILPASTKIHPVFHISMLKMYRNPVDDHLAKKVPQPLDWLEGVPTFEVEAILGHRFEKARKKKPSLQYLIRWAGFDESHDSWEPEELGGNYSELAAQYKELHPTPAPERTRKAKKPKVHNTRIMTIEDSSEADCVEIPEPAPPELIPPIILNTSRKMKANVKPLPTRISKRRKFENSRYK